MAEIKRRRVGIIGAGWVSEYHLPAWMKQSARAEVVAIADPSVEARAARSEAFGIPRNYASAEAMLAEEALDAVDICAPREAHVELVRLAAAKRSRYSLPEAAGARLRTGSCSRCRSAAVHPLDGARELAVSRLLPPAEGLAGGRDCRQYQAGPVRILLKRHDCRY